MKTEELILSDPLSMFPKSPWNMPPIMKEHRWCFQENYMAFSFRALDRSSKILSYFLFSAGTLSLKSVTKTVFAKGWVETNIGVSWQRSKTSYFFETPVRTSHGEKYISLNNPAPQSTQNSWRLPQELSWFLRKHMSSVHIDKHYFIFADEGASSLVRNVQLQFFFPCCAVCLCVCSDLLLNYFS